MTMPLNSSLQDATHKQELSQARLRIAVFAAGCLYALWLYSGSEASGVTVSATMLAGIVTSYGVFALVSYALVATNRFAPALRRHVAIVVDTAMSSALVLTMSEHGAMFYILYLWVVIGNGLRFGERYMWVAHGLAVLGSAVALSLNPFWLSHPFLSVSLWLGILFLPLFFVVALRRVESLNKKLQQQLDAAAHAAAHDELTGLANRRLFMELFENVIALARRKDVSGAVFYIDLDGFKEVNDTYGHAMGDELLIEIAQRLGASVRESDTVARLGGDEFVVLAPDVNAQADGEFINVRVFAGKLQEIIKEPVTLHDHTLRVGASIGVAMFPDGVASADQVLRDADAAMYQAKHAGRDQFILARVS